MNAPEAASQIISGLFDLEEGKQRWTSGTATVVLVNPPSPEPLHATFYVPENAAARRATIALDKRAVHSEAIGPGMHRMVTSPIKAAEATSIVSLTVDRTFSAPGDSRALGVVLLNIGWGR